jgi:Spy/CpxP family protein refolding chaperone
MKINLLAVGVLAAALAVPLGASAQQDQQYQGPPQQRAGTPSPARLQHRWMKRLSHLNLSSDQQQRIQSMIQQYSQAHPEGSAPDPDGKRALRQQIMGVLSSDQQNQLHQEMQAHRAAMRQRDGQGQQNQGPPQDQQGPPPQDQQGPPPQYPAGPPPGDQPPPR